MPYFTKMQDRVFYVGLKSANNLELLQGALKNLTRENHKILSGLKMNYI